MERASFELLKHLSQITQVRLIKWGGSNRWLPLILPYFLFMALWFLLTKRIRVIYIQDGLLAPLGLILKLITRKPIIITIHGRDITYDNSFYQFLIPKCLRCLDKIICVSKATKLQCTNRNINGNIITIIPNGISDEYYNRDNKINIRDQLAKTLAVNLNAKKILLSVGRLVERKGIHWFIENVLPTLRGNGEDYIYIIVGKGSFSNTIEYIIQETKLGQNIIMLGQVEETTLKLIYNASDIFIMPNISIQGDMEGFGLVALEAASCALPVVASDLEGIKDAIQDGRNGFLIEPYNSQVFTNNIRELLKNEEMRKSFGENARQYTLENYGWDKMAQKYMDIFNKLTNNS